MSNVPMDVISKEAVVAPVDEMLPKDRLFFYGLQHVLVMYAGSIAIPILIGGAAGLSVDEIAFLISADLFIAGIASFIQAVGIGGFGIRLPVMMGVTFSAVPPMLVMVSNPSVGLTGMFGAVIAAGLVGLCIAPIMGKLVRYFPPIVTGTIILATGVNLIPVGVNWIGGVGNKAATPTDLAITFFVLLVITAIMRFATGFLRNIAVLVGILVGFVVAISLGKVQDFSRVMTADWVGLIPPFHFGFPTFDFGSVLALSIIMVVIMVETTGMMLTIGMMVGKKLESRDITRGLRAEGLASVLGGIFNTYPYVTYTTNLSLIAVTGVKTRWVCVAASCILVVLAMFPKVAMTFALVPHSVLGGAAIVMFGMVVGTGVKVLAESSFEGEKGRNNLYVLSVSSVLGMIPLVNKKVFALFPDWASAFTHNGIVLAAVTALVLNILLNGPTKVDGPGRD